MGSGAGESGGGEVVADIREAWTLPAEIYRDPGCYRLQVEGVFARSWQDVPAAGLERPRSVRPFTLLEGSLDEPLVLTRDEAGRLHCLSNVCTHRANLVVERPCSEGRGLRCRYHGRRFGLDGRFLSMPEFDGVVGFPGPSDDLPSLPVEALGPLVFTSLDPALPFDRFIAPVLRRVDWMPLDQFRFDQATSRSYDVNAHWALYCDNFLEGFHIPYVHQALAEQVDYGSYRTETWEHGSLQIALARSPEAEPSHEPRPGPGPEGPAGSAPHGSRPSPGPTFGELPHQHPDHGLPVAAWYFWLFPNVLLNFYPWGLSFNVVEPRGLARTRVRFESWVWRPELRDTGAGAELHRVELEDEAVVEAAQRGVRSRLYRRGRFSPARELGVHHFHRLLAAELARAGWPGATSPAPRR